MKKSFFIIEKINKNTESAQLCMTLIRFACTGDTVNIMLVLD